MTTNTVKDLNTESSYCKPERAQLDWYLGPVGTSRDADSVVRSNWRVLIERVVAVDPEGVDHEIIHMGHWAVGWVEYLAVRPGSQAAVVQSQAIDKLREHVILNEDDLSMIEHDDMTESWDSYGDTQFKRDLLKRLDDVDPKHEHDLDDVDLWEQFRDLDGDWEHDGNSVSFTVPWSKWDLTELADKYRQVSEPVSE